MKKTSSVEIIDFSSDLKQHFKRLNLEWLEKNFDVEPVDVQLLSNPQENIIAKGGYIFYARIAGEIVGTVALLKLEKSTYELSKMGVTPKYRGRGIGKKLIEHCLNFAKAHNFHAVVLYSARKLKPAIHLYYKYGFKEVPLESDVCYARCDIKMEKKF